MVAAELNNTSSRADKRATPFFAVALSNGGTHSPSAQGDRERVMASCSHAAYHLEALRRQRIIDRASELRKQRENEVNTNCV